MKKATVIAIGHHRAAALEALQNLGLLHVHQVEKPATTASAVTERLKALSAVIELLAAAPPLPPTSFCDPEQVVADVQQLLADRDQLATQLQQERARIDAARVWGEFDPARIAALATHGVIVKLYRCAPSQMPAVPAGCLIHEITRDKSTVAFAIVGRAPFSIDLTETKPPSVSLSEMTRRATEIDRQIAGQTEAVATHASALPALRAHARTLEDDCARAEAHDHTLDAGILAYLQGFLPFDRVAALQQAARAHGWGLVIENPSADDAVPTLIRNPRWLRPIETIFNFIDTFPGYFELDVSPVFYLFFSLFYAMLIGDAGYGTLMLAATIAIHVLARKTVPRGPLYLFYVLNTATIAWGIMTGSYFGLAPPKESVLARLVCLNAADFSQIVFICFIIAVVHLTLAHLWRAVLIINSWRAVEQLCWAGVVVAMYFVANMLILGRPMPSFVLWLGAASIAGAFIGAVWAQKGEDLIAAIIQFPFGIINCFGDIASYIRLFAVGFAGAATAQAFNTIASQIGMDTVLSKGVMVLVLVLGHSLNIVLGLLAVIVHALRLNTLEFSSHMALEWKGTKYRPFRFRHVRPTT